MKKYFATILILITCYSIVYGQNVTTHSVPKHRVGLTAGFTTGLGMFYRYMPEDKGIQVSFLPIRISDLSTYETEKTTIISAGYIDRFRTKKHIDLSFYESQMLVISRGMGSNETDGAMTIGAGTLADVRLGYDMNMSINLGIVYMFDFGDSGVLGSNWMLLPDFGLGFSYKF